MKIDLVTACTRCGTKWEGDFEYCPKCEPVLASAERRGIESAFEDQEPFDYNESEVA